MIATSIEDVLSHIPAIDRDVWLRCAMALKSEYGDQGLAVFNRWSQSAPNYDRRAVQTTWRSIRQSGAIRVDWIYREAKRHGWAGREIPGEQTVRRQGVDLEARDELWRKQEAARAKAGQMIESATLSSHPYLVRKGFPRERGFVLNGRLLIPMRSMGNTRLNSLQMIAADGSKRFLAGGQAKGSVFAMGTGDERYFCEGYATGLSIRAALQSLHRQAYVVVCFSAHNLQWVASQGRGIVIADNDASGTGQRCAAESVRSWWMPPNVGQDANDFMMERGVRGLAAVINNLRREELDRSRCSSPPRRLAGTSAKREGREPLD